MSKVTFLQPEATNKTLTAALEAQTHAYLLLGIQGVGKTDIAIQLAAHWLNIKPTKVNMHSSVLILGKDTELIGIDEIRSLQQFLRLKTLGSRDVRRVVILLNVQNMSDQAQNAILKTLEEPPEDTRIILTTSDGRTLRPTIISRVHSVHLHPISHEMAYEHFSALGHKDLEIREAYSLSQGAVGLMTSLLDEAEEHPLTLSLKQAKEILTSTAYDRLLLVDGLSKQKDEIARLLESCKLIAHSGLQQAAQKGTSHKRWEQMLRLIAEAQVSLSKNANTKLLLTDLFVRL